MGCKCNNCHMPKSCYTNCNRCTKVIKIPTEPVTELPITTDDVTTVEEYNICSTIFPAGTLLTDVLGEVIENILCSIPVNTDVFVKVDAADGTAGYLFNKLIGGNGTTVEATGLISNKKLRVKARLSADSNNNISFGSDGGLFVPTPVASASPVPNSKTDSNAIQLILSGTLNRHIVANLKLDPTSTAPVSITPQGLKVDCCAQVAPPIQFSTNSFCDDPTGAFVPHYTINGPCNPGSTYTVQMRTLPSGTFSNILTNVTCSAFPYTVSPGSTPVQFKILQNSPNGTNEIILTPTVINCETTPVCLPPTNLIVDSDDLTSHVEVTFTWTNSGTPTATYLNVNGLIYNVTGLTTYTANFPHNTSLQINLHNECGELNSSAIITTHTTPERILSNPESLTVESSFDTGAGCCIMMFSWISNSPDGTSEFRVNGVLQGMVSSPFGLCIPDGEIVNVHIRNTYNGEYSLALTGVFTGCAAPCDPPVDLVLTLEAVQPYGETRELVIDWDPNNLSGQSLMTINGVDYGLTTPPFTYLATQNGASVTVNIKNQCGLNTSATVGDTVTVDLVEPDLTCQLPDVSHAFVGDDVLAVFMNNLGGVENYDILVVSSNVVSSPVSRTEQTAVTQFFDLVSGPTTATTYTITVSYLCENGAINETEYVVTIDP